MLTSKVFFSPTVAKLRVGGKTLTVTASEMSVLAVSQVASPKLVTMLVIVHGLDARKATIDGRFSFPADFCFTFEQDTSSLQVMIIEPFCP